MIAEVLNFPVDMIVHKATRENTLLRVFASVVREAVVLRRLGRSSDLGALEDIETALGILNKALSGALEAQKVEG